LIKLATETLSSETDEKLEADDSLESSSLSANPLQQSAPGLNGSLETSGASDHQLTLKDPFLRHIALFGNSTEWSNQIPITNVILDHYLHHVLGGNKMFSFGT